MGNKDGANAAAGGGGGANAPAGGGGSRRPNASSPGAPAARTPQPPSSSDNSLYDFFEGVGTAGSAGLRMADNALSSLLGVRPGLSSTPAGKSGQELAQSGPGAAGVGPSGQGQQNPADAPQQAPANGNQADQNGLDLDQLAGYAKTFGSHLGQAAVAAAIGSVVIGGLLALAASAGPVAGGVAIAAGAILLARSCMNWSRRLKRSTRARIAPVQPCLPMTGLELRGMRRVACRRLFGGKALSFGKGAFSAKPQEAAPGSQECTGDWCFPAGTLVATEDGPKVIERIAANERVWAYDLKTQSWRLCRVIKPLDRFHAGDYVSIDLERETIESTGGHPFWVVAGEGLADRPEPDHVDAFGARVRDTGPMGRRARPALRRPALATLRRCRQNQRGSSLCPVPGSLQPHVEQLQSYAVGFSQVLTHNYPDEVGPGAGASRQELVLQRQEQSHGRT